MKRLVLATFAAGLLSGSLYAGEVYMSAEETLATFLSRQSGMARKIGTTDKAGYSLVLTGEDSALYGYNTADAFVILDASGGEVIGYGSRPLDVDRLPEGLEVMLKAFARTPAFAPDVTLHDAIAPLVTAKWDQDDPYNLDCPLLNGQLCVTGCAATAISQVLYCPVNRMQPSGKYDYLWTQTGQRLSFDFDAHPVDYAAMTDTYDKFSSEESRAAVANLMHAVGSAINMNYTPQMSGATAVEEGAGLIRNLGCDKGLRLLYRDFYSDAEWDRMLYDNMAAGYPLVYSGYSSDMGHAFVCDGYESRDGRGYYHINWGWSGNADGFYDITRLNPGYLGIGGGNSMSGFNFDQHALFGIRPDSGSGTPQIDFWQYGALQPVEQESTRRGRVNLIFTGNPDYDGGCILSGCLQDVYARIGFKYINVETGEVTRMVLSQSLLFNVGSGFQEMVMPCQLFPEEDGTYICKLSFLIDDTWYDAREELAYLSDLKVTLDGNNVRFSRDDLGVRLHAEFVDFPGYVERNSATRLEVLFKAMKEDVDTDVIPTITTASGKILWKQSAQHLILGYGESTTLIWDEPFTPATRRGTYMLTLQNADEENLIAPITINVVNEGASVAEMEEESDTKYEYYTIDGLRVDPDAVVPGTILLKKSYDKMMKVLR